MNVLASVVLVLAAWVSTVASPDAKAASPTAPPPGGARELTPGFIPSFCTADDNTGNTFGATFGYYWSEQSSAWISAPYCYARWGYLDLSPSQVIDAGDTVTVTALPADGRMAGFVAQFGGWSWRYPGTLVSGCGTKDISCTVRLGNPDRPPSEWSWNEFHLSGPGRVFILPPSYAPRCQPDTPCLDTTTNAWTYVGVRPQEEKSTLDASLRASPDDIVPGDRFTVTLQVTNPNPREILNVTPQSALVIGGVGKVSLIANPSVPQIASLAPGARASFEWTFEALEEGLVTFDINAQATAKSGELLSVAAHCGLDDGTAKSLRVALNKLPDNICGTQGGARVSIGTKGLDVTWEMPQRYFSNTNWSTRDGVIPRQEVNPPYWDVTLILKENGKALTACPANRAYRWSVKFIGPKGGPKPKPVIVEGRTCRENIKVDREGVYQVDVEELEAATETPTGREARDKSVTVQDWLIVAVGDSNGSGQGTAIEGTGYHFPQCDRGPYSYQAKVAEAIEDADKRTSVTFIHTACSGARTIHLTDKVYEGQEPDSTNVLPPQFDQVARRLEGARIRREVDAMILSIGINDVYFGGLLKLCIENTHLLIKNEFEPSQQFPPCQDLKVKRGRLPNGEPTLLEVNKPGRYPTLDEFMRTKALANLRRKYNPVAREMKGLKIRPA